MSYGPLLLASQTYLPIRLTEGSGSVTGPGVGNGDFGNGVTFNGCPDQYRGGGSFPAVVRVSSSFPAIRRAS